jgi:hypothetical protein
VNLSNLAAHDVFTPTTNVGNSTLVIMAEHKNFLGVAKEVPSRRGGMTATTVGVEKRSTTVRKKTESALVLRLVQQKAELSTE